MVHGRKISCCLLKHQGNHFILVGPFLLPMSRCFPFPPPGYQTNIKVNADHPAPLIKEQNREKNHNKESKCKEKKESKEKRGKERIYEKHREKKDKKEKHKDKKEKGLDNDKHKGIGLFSDEKRPVGPLNADLHKLREKSKNRENDGSVSMFEKRVAGQSIFNYAEPVSKSNHLASHTKINKNASELGTSNFDGERRINNQYSIKNVYAEKNKDGVVNFTGIGAIPVLVGREKTNEKTADVKKTGALRLVGENKFCENALAQNVLRPVNLPDKSPRPMAEGKERKQKQAIVGMVQNRVGAMVRPVEKPMVEEKEQARVTHKESDGEKPIHKVKDLDMVTKEDENVKATSELKRHAQMQSKRDGNEHHMSTPSAKNDWKDLPALLSNGIQNILNTSNEGTATLLGKRKDIGPSGMYDEQMTKPNKLARTTASTHQVTEISSYQNSAAFAVRPPMNIKVERTFAPDGTQRPSTNIKVEGSARKLNDTKTSPITQSSQMTSKSTRKSEVSAKPLHPDTKYLTQVLTVPKLDQWPEFDDQEWLFRGNNSQSGKTKVETSWVDEEPKVWASTVWLDQVHIFAFPYVIPY